MTIQNETSTEETEEGKESTEVDYKVEFETLKTSYGTLEQKMKSLEGRQAVKVDGPDMVAAMTEMRAESARMRRQLLEVSDIAEDQKKSGLDALDTEERQRAERSEFVTRSNRIADRTFDRIEKSGVPADSPEIKAFVESWSSATKLSDREDIADQIEDYLATAVKERTKAEKEAEDKKETEKDQEQNRDENSLASGIKTSSGSGRSPSWDQAQKIKNVSDISDAEYKKLVS